MSDMTSMLVPLAGTFPGWPAADTPSVAQSLLVVIGIPVLVSVLIAVLVLARTLARQGRGEQLHVREPLWVGDSAPELTAVRARELTTGSENPGSHNPGSDKDSTTGGASVRW